MTNSPTPGLSWTVRSVVVSVVASLVGLLVALALKELGIWPEWDYSEVIFGGLCGATAVHRMHPGRPIVVLLVVVPVMAVLLLIGRVVFDLYVLGRPIDL